MTFPRLRLRLAIVRRCSTKSRPTKEWSDTVLTPKTNFPQKVQGDKRVKLDEAITSSKDFRSVYQRQLSSDKPLWILHDGPPYANGPAHIGHAVNKILKDITNRSKVLAGFRSHYVPGWDCHGLPIELKALSKAKTKSRDDNALEIRQLSREFALEAIQGQKAEFMSWGIMGDWSNPYLTMNKDMVRAQLVAFNSLYKKGFIYERFMPVYWSPSSRTALAESELEYNPNHVSTAIYVRFPIVRETIPERLAPMADDLFFLSWTTTPWSLVANKAIAYKHDACYVVAQSHQGDKYYILAKDLYFGNEELQELFSAIITEISVGELARMQYKHPLDGNETMRLFPGAHVTLNAGTGLVHTAPSHGQEDYLLGVDNQLDLSCPVDELGKYDDSAGAHLSGLDVLGTGNEKILELLSAKGHILKETKFVHSYPYDWRTKKPVILRGSRQWFMDTKSLQPLALEALDSIKCNMNHSFESILRTRPYWCISRQRVWGVPIPMFYDEEKGQSVTSDDLIDRLCNLLDKSGNIDFWWQMTDAELLRGTDLQLRHLTKGKDILDVWFDSGVTWHGVLPSAPEQSVKKADLYLEGLDQFSGWFYSSLLTSMGAQGTSAYKQLFVHGFTMDENGRKMSKSLGNVVAPSEITRGQKSGKKSKFDTMGVDVLRYWVGAHACQTPAIQISDNVLQSSKADVDRIRNTCRFIIGNLESSFHFEEVLNYQDMKAVDQFILHQLYNFCSSLSQLYEDMAFNKVCWSSQNFIANDLSGFYFSLIKDRLYCDSKTSVGRKSAVSALYWIGHGLAKSLSPILPILAHEIGQHCPALRLDLAEELVLLQEWNNPQLEAIFEPILKVRKLLNQSKVKRSDCVQLTCDLSLSPEDLAEIWQVSKVQVVKEIQDPIFDCELLNNREKVLVNFEVGTQLHKCPRCRLFQSLEADSLCPRCKSVLDAIID